MIELFRCTAVARGDGREPAPGSAAVAEGRDATGGQPTGRRGQPAARLRRTASIRRRQSGGLGAALRRGARQRAAGRSSSSARRQFCLLQHRR